MNTNDECENLDYAKSRLLMNHIYKVIDTYEQEPKIILAALTMLLVYFFRKTMSSKEDFLLFIIRNWYNFTFEGIKFQHDGQSGKDDLNV
jgi:hypothetical protein